MGKTNRNSNLKSFRKFYEEDEWGGSKKPRTDKPSKKREKQLMREIKNGSYEDLNKLEELDDLYDD